MLWSLTNSLWKSISLEVYGPIWNGRETLLPTQECVVCFTFAFSNWICQNVFVLTCPPGTMRWLPTSTFRLCISLYLLLRSTIRERCQSPAYSAQYHFGLNLGPLPPTIVPMPVIPSPWCLKPIKKKIKNFKLTNWQRYHSPVFLVLYVEFLNLICLGASLIHAKLIIILFNTSKEINASILNFEPINFLLINLPIKFIYDLLRKKKIHICSKEGRGFGYCTLVYYLVPIKRKNT